MAHTWSQENKHACRSCKTAREAAVEAVPNDGQPNVATLGSLHQVKTPV
jgi:hypothetical protein